MTISACIPCFNARATLAAAIESIANQSRPVCDLLVVDDGSEDGSGAIAQAAGARVVRHPANLGRGAARATAVREARGDLILFCDSGLGLPPLHLELAAARLQEASVAAVFGWVNSHGPSVAHRWRARHLFKTGAEKSLRADALLATAGALLRRSATLAVGNFREDLRAAEDADLGRRLLAGGYSVIFDPALEVRSLTLDSVASVLRRYARWNAAPGSRPTFSHYLRLVSYSIKVMAREDLRHGDLACALVSVICPYFQLWNAQRS